MIQIGTGVSTEHDPREAGAAAARAAAEGLDGAPPDLALVFASGSHLVAPESTLEGIRDVLAPAELVGCGAGGVLGHGREHESGTALVVWAASLGDGGETMPFHAALTDEDSEATVIGLPDLDGSSGLLMFSDPYSFPTEAVLEFLAAQAPAVPVLGGLSSARTIAGDAALFFGEEVREDGAVGVRLRGVEMLPCVSQGAAPLGREVTITAAEENVIHELAGRPALQTLQRLIADLRPPERALLSDGLLIGVVIDGGKPEYEQGNFLVRGILGADSDSGAVMVGTRVEPGQVVRLHARDAGSADADLRQALGVGVQAMAGEPPAGALVFSCNGRGSAMFGVADHDAAAIDEELGGAPSAGFFAAGEIGPVGGRSFLHGFTATVALFPRTS